MDKVQKYSNPKCYTSSSEPFRKFIPQIPYETILQYFRLSRQSLNIYSTMKYFTTNTKFEAKQKLVTECKCAKICATH
jgi:hypothetical protein